LPARRSAEPCEHRRVQAQVLRRTTAGNDERVVVLGLHGVEIGIQGEVVARLLAVGLVAFEIVHGGAHLFAGLLAGTHGVHRMADHQQGLERHHGFVVLGKVTGEHQDLLGCHEGLLGLSVASARARHVARSGGCRARRQRSTEHDQA
jgi:hypothetical protein